MILTNTQEYNILYVQSGCCSHYLIVDSNTRTQPSGKSYNLGWWHRIVTTRHGEMMKASYVLIASRASQDRCLNIRVAFFLVAMGDISLRKTSMEEKRTKLQKESKVLLNYTRKALARFMYLKRILAQLEDDVAPCEVQMENWKTNLAIMATKERQYLQQKTSHGVLVEMAKHKKELEKKTKPINKTLDINLLDKALAALTIERKKREYTDAEKRLEDVLHSALSPLE
ncbi:hypothetical protein UlMin_014014 [Ulmus minor]